MKYAAVLFVLVTMVFSLSAQQQGGQWQSKGGGNFTPQDRAKKTIDKFGELTILLPTQRDSLVKIYADFYTNIQQFRATGGDNKATLTAFETNRDEQVQKVLAGEQLKVYQKFVADEKAEREKRMQENSGRGGGGGGHGGYGGHHGGF